MTECRACGQAVPTGEGGRVGETRQHRLCGECWTIYQEDSLDPQL